MCVLPREGSVGAFRSDVYVFPIFARVLSVSRVRRYPPLFLPLLHSFARNCGHVPTETTRGGEVKELRVRCQCLCCQNMSWQPTAWHTIVEAVRMRETSRRVPLSPCIVTPLGPHTRLELIRLPLGQQRGTDQRHRVEVFILCCR